MGRETDEEDEEGDEVEEHCDCSHGDKESAPAPEQSVLSTQGSVQLTHRDGGRANAVVAALEEQRCTVH